MIITLTSANFSGSNINSLMGALHTINFTCIDESDQPLTASSGNPGYLRDGNNITFNASNTPRISGYTFQSANPPSITNITEDKNVTVKYAVSSSGGGGGTTPTYTMLSEREYPDTNVNINATSKAGDSLEMIAKFTYGRQADPAGKKQILCGSNMGVLMMINPETKVMTNNTNMGTYALTEGSEYYMKIKLVPSGNKSVMTSTIYNGTDTTLSTPLDSISRDITNADPYPLYVGSSQITSASTLAATMNSGIKIKEFWVYKPSGTLIFNGVPAKRNSDNAYGLWDSVTESFFAEEKIIIS